MSQDLTISLPEELRQQAIDFAATRGETVDIVVREAVAQYVSVLAPESAAGATSEPAPNRTWGTIKETARPGTCHGRICLAVGRSPA